MNKFKKKLPQIVLQISLFLLCIIMLAPFAWVISTSLRLPSESFKLPPSFLPTSFHYQNYIAVFTSFPFAQCILNSLKIAVIVVASNLIVTTMAGVAISLVVPTLLYIFGQKHILQSAVMSGLKC